MIRVFLLVNFDNMPPTFRSSPKICPPSTFRVSPESCPNNPDHCYDAGLRWLILVVLFKLFHNLHRKAKKKMIWIFYKTFYKTNIKSMEFLMFWIFIVQCIVEVDTGRYNIIQLLTSYEVNIESWKITSRGLTTWSSPHIRA